MHIQFFAKANHIKTLYLSNSRSKCKCVGRNMAIYSITTATLLHKLHQHTKMSKVAIDNKLKQTVILLQKQINRCHSRGRNIDANYL